MASRSSRQRFDSAQGQRSPRVDSHRKREPMPRGTVTRSQTPSPDRQTSRRRSQLSADWPAAWRHAAMRPRASRRTNPEGLTCIACCACGRGVRRWFGIRPEAGILRGLSASRVYLRPAAAHLPGSGGIDYCGARGSGRHERKRDYRV